MAPFSFSEKSLSQLYRCHPVLQAILHQAIKVTDFRILDSTRGPRAQMMAYRTGRSKARFGQSPHNYVPALAVDLFPAPYEWNNKASFIALAEVVLGIAKAGGVDVRWGGDWNRDGDIKDGWDFPHFELHPWKVYAERDCRLVD